MTIWGQFHLRVRSGHISRLLLQQKGENESLALAEEEMSRENVGKSNGGGSGRSQRENVTRRASGVDSTPPALKALSMPTLDDQIRSILESESPREPTNASPSHVAARQSDPALKNLVPDSAARSRAFASKRVSTRSGFIMNDENIESEPGADASWVVEQQNCASEILLP